MVEVVGGGVFDHAVFDVAAFRRIVYLGFPGAVVHQPSNLPMPAETESLADGVGHRMPSRRKLDVDDASPLTD